MISRTGDGALLCIVAVLRSWASDPFSATDGPVLITIAFDAQSLMTKDLLRHIA